MSKKDEALKLALVALEVVNRIDLRQVNEAITAIREALAKSRSDVEQPAPVPEAHKQQEPKKFDPNESFAREEAAQARVREFMRNH